MLARQRNEGRRCDWPRFLLAVIFIVSFWPLPLHAADPAKELRKVEKTLQNKRAAAARAAAAAKQAQQEMKLLQKELREAAADEAKQQAVSDALVEEMKTLDAQAMRQRAHLAEIAQNQSRALGVMLRLARVPPAILWIQDGVSLRQERRMIFLRAAFRGLEARAGQLQHELQEAERWRERLASKKLKLEEVKAALHKKKGGLNALIARRQALAAAHQSQHETLRGEAARLAASAADLHALLDKMARSRKVSRPARQPQPSLAKGRMIMPIAGRVKQAFGVQDNFGVTSRGATLAASPGGRIVAPWGGKAVFAGPFKGYGDILILQHGADYHSLLAGFGRIDVTVGQSVAAGEPVGVLGQPKNGQDMAELYFELRQDGSPVNPLLVSVQHSP